jgi:hypothetical protein
MQPQPFQKYLEEYRKQLAKGDVKAAYQGLIAYFKELRLTLKNRHPDYFVTDVQPGQMDVTYLYFFPKTLKRKNLKVVIIFFHGTFRLEVWLAGYNKSVQAKYWKLFKENGYNKYTLAPTPKEGDSILQYTLNDNPDFSNPEALTNQIEIGTLTFIKDVENFLSKQ